MVALSLTTETDYLLVCTACTIRYFVIMVLRLHLAFCCHRIAFINGDFHSLSNRNLLLFGASPRCPGDITAQHPLLLDAAFDVISAAFNQKTPLEAITAIGESGL